MTGCELVVADGTTMCLIKVRHDGYDLNDLAASLAGDTRVWTPASLCHHLQDAVHNQWGYPINGLDEIETRWPYGFSRKDIGSRDWLALSDAFHSDIIAVDPDDELSCSYTDYTVYIHLDNRGVIDSMEWVDSAGSDPRADANGTITWNR